MPGGGGKSSGGAAAGRSSGTIEKKYVKLSQRDHILQRPDSYVGSVDNMTERQWVYDAVRKCMVKKELCFVPALYKIFDEILVNAADNVQRCPQTKRIQIDVDAENGLICVQNDGTGIPVVVHKEQKMYVPQMIFGNLLTSSNYDDAQLKTVGGRNGYGAKLANIYSSKFIVECQDRTRSLRYKQVWKDSMSTMGKPQMKASTAKDFVKVTFQPDMKLFGSSSWKDKQRKTGFSDDMVAMFHKRAVDIAGTTPRRVRVLFNGTRIDVASFRDYVSLYFNQQGNASLDAVVTVADSLGGSQLSQTQDDVSLSQSVTSKPVFQKVNDCWEVAVYVSEGEFEQVSFVNNVCTTQGGTHVKYIADQVAKYIVGRVQKERGRKVTPHQIKSHMWVFVNSLINNPGFNTQTKLTLTTNRRKFGSTCVLSSHFLRKVAKSPIMTSVMEWSDRKSMKVLEKTGGRKKSRLTGIEKLSDANDAGTKKGSLCTLILTEGDSAMALAIAGIAVAKGGRNRYGVFPLKGKLLNCRDASAAQVAKNKEINSLKQILGLRHNVEYHDTKNLRYGRVMIMTDQDHDGSHIKGLVVNFFHHFWPSLMRIPGFLTVFLTPIIKARRGQTVKSFYSMPEYDEWLEEMGGSTSGWKIKYYKGLGTSTAKEAKEYFSDLDTHTVNFKYNAGVDDRSLKMAFARSSADARKRWIMAYDPTQTSLNQRRLTELQVSEFVNRELILYSIASNLRAIPSVIDGFKPGQRKVLYAAFKRKLTKDVRVSQFAGYVSEHAVYHHGEASLNSTIIGMAQNFCGANNLNFFVPSGMFGTRHQGGHDSASPRYVFTRLNAMTRSLFHPSDDPLLAYNFEDDTKIEPAWYCPVIPSILINGASGIGTGWSTSIPRYNPREVVNNVLRLLDEKELTPLRPWYAGHNGELVAGSKAGTFLSCGRFEQLSATILRIYELPVGKWTQDYKKFLEGLLDNNTLRDFREYHTNNTVDFVLVFGDESKLNAMASHSSLNLTSRINSSNMVAFDTTGRIKKYQSPNEILREFFPVRLQYYRKRKDHLADELTRKVKILRAKVKFVEGIIDQTVVIQHKTKSQIVDHLLDCGFEPLEKGRSGGDSSVDDSDEEGEMKGSSSTSSGGGGGSFDYLLSMKLWSLTQEKVDQLKHQQADATQELDKLLATDPKDMWRVDLYVFLEKWDGYMDALASEDQKAIARQEKTKKKAHRALQGNRREEQMRKWAYAAVGKGSVAVKMQDVVKIEGGAGLGAKHAVVSPSTATVKTKKPPVKKQTTKKTATGKKTAAGKSGATARKRTAKAAAAAEGAAGVPSKKKVDPMKARYTALRKPLKVLKQSGTTPAAKKPAAKKKGVATANPGENVDIFATPGDAVVVLDDSDDELNQLLSSGQSLMQRLEAKLGPLDVGGTEKSHTHDDSSDGDDVLVIGSPRDIVGRKRPRTTTRRKAAAVKKKRRTIADSEDDEESAGSDSEFVPSG